MIGKFILEVLFGKGADAFLASSGLEVLFFASSDSPIWASAQQCLEFPLRSGLIILPTRTTATERAGGPEGVFRILMNMLPSGSYIDELPTYYYLTIPLPTGHEVEVCVTGVSLEPVSHSALGPYTLDYICAGSSSLGYTRCVGSQARVGFVVVDESQGPAAPESFIPSSSKEAVTVVSRAFEQYSSPNGGGASLSWTNERLSEPWVLMSTSCQWVVFP